MDVLKLFPLRGWQIVAGELLAPTVILTAVQWALLLVLALVLGADTGLLHLPKPPLPWFLAAMTGASPALRLAAGALLGLRWGVEVTIARLSGRPLSWRDAALLPVRDLCAATLFWAGLAGRSVSWRGRQLVIGKQTRILRKAA